MQNDRKMQQTTKKHKRRPSQMSKKKKGAPIGPNSKKEGRNDAGGPTFFKRL